MKGYYIQITNGLLDAEHYNRMGQAVWLFMWYLDKMTSVSEEGIGLVLGGKPIKFEEVEEDLGMSYATYKRWVSTLRKQGYIDTTRTSFGIIVRVAKAQKTFGQKTKKNKDDSSILSRPSDNDGELTNEPSGELNNEPVTAQDRASDSSKVDKHSRQDNDKTMTLVADATPTPGELARDFMAQGESYALLIDSLAQKYDRAAVEAEVQKFLLYWTEPTKSGKKVRWETEKTFEVKRRLLTWLNRSKSFTTTRAPGPAMTSV